LTRIKSPPHRIASLAIVTPTPLAYSCSGCSSAAQLANHLAIQLDRLGVAEMSCIAGVGGDVPSLVKLARRGRPIVALDGCPLHCVRRCLDRHGLTPALHLTLTEHGVIKRQHMDFDPAQAEQLLGELVEQLRRLKAA
jgi:uncharacterized metal-binding protein